VDGDLSLKHVEEFMWMIFCYRYILCALVYMDDRFRNVCVWHFCSFHCCHTDWPFTLFKNLIKTIFLLNLIIIKWITRHHIRCWMDNEVLFIILKIVFLHFVHWCILLLFLLCVIWNVGDIWWCLFQFSIPGSNFVFQPEIYVTVIAHTPFFTTPAQQVPLTCDIFSQNANNKILLFSILLFQFHPNHDSSS
jgi:hypothetical protein